MRIVSIATSAGGTQSLQPGAGILYYVLAFAGNTVVSADPSISADTFFAPAANKVFDGFYLIANSAVPVEIRIEDQQTIYVSTVTGAGSGVIQLFLNDISAETTK